MTAARRGRGLWLHPRQQQQQRQEGQVVDPWGFCGRHCIHLATLLQLPIAGAVLQSNRRPRSECAVEAYAVL